ncbi:NUMOD3 domain-containing DNA-binding protein [Thalassotalea nanhaiensis]|uniref:NUMOD3 domain-containing DNA-binding protein n=1 Tax=Thalassotalea nanhaiensis TaxID=3065648 RepID=A0ABY9TFI8_9GAMM|nr:NUMOD3 domain-containing DNA-binding protein [Colwelliaceae bacterium SQ345]
MPDKVINRKHSPETKAKISASMTGKNNPRFGAKLTDNHKKALTKGRIKAQAEGKMGRPIVNPKITVNGYSFQLTNNVKTATFNGIKAILAHSKLNPNGYFNNEWFARRNITIKFLNK